MKIGRNSVRRRYVCTFMMRLQLSDIYDVGIPVVYDYINIIIIILLLSLIVQRDMSVM